jgi:hypothetical protein
MPKSLKELKAELAAEEKKVKERFAEKMKKAKELERAEALRQAKRKRALENHGKYLLAGWIVAEAKRTKNIELLKNCLASLKDERDVLAVKALIDSLK